MQITSIKVRSCVGALTTVELCRVEPYLYSNGLLMAFDRADAGPIDHPFVYLMQPRHLRSPRLALPTRSVRELSKYFRFRLILALTPTAMAISLMIKVAVFGSEQANVRACLQLDRPTASLLVCILVIHMDYYLLLNVNFSQCNNCNISISSIFFSNIFFV